ncbi:general transcription factor II-I repeat domain-containing protein 2A-like [Megachile rotundata]|uniref:general transcription factor II-I repeat domain-containing protein 2A-like n=1 Tax=Megachile rotundata TaxID=143995 RepID=UPI003FD17E79
MSEPKRRKVDFENRIFQAKWTEDFFFILPPHKNAKPTCLICNETVAACKAANISRYYETKHLKKYDKDFPKGSSLRIEKINILRSSFEHSQIIMKRSTSDQEKCTEASLRVAWILAKHMVAFSYSEVVKECLIQVSNAVFNNKKEITEMFNKIPLSRDSAIRKTEICAKSVHESILADLTKTQFFSLAIDESTDISDVAQMAVFVRYILNNNYKEELLTLLPLHDRTTGQILFECFQEFMNNNNLSYQKILSVDTDGAPAMIGKTNGFVTLLKQINSKVISLHCIIHQSVLCAKLSNDLKNVMNTVMKIINYLKSHSALQHRLLRAFLEECNSEYTDLLLHNDVRWLSKGNVLKRLITLLSEISDFLKSRNTKMATEYYEFLCNANNTAKLCFLCDMFSHINDLNLALQGKGKLICDIWEKIKAFQRKLKLFENDLNSRELIHFPLLKAHFESNEKIPQFKEYERFLKDMQTEFASRFTDFGQIDDLLKAMQSPFSLETNGNWVNAAVQLFTLEKAKLQLEIIEFQESNVLREKFAETDITQFWIDTLPEQSYPNLKQMGTLLCTMFGSTYVCEAAFSKMNIIKNKYRNRITDNHLRDCMLVANTTYEPNFTKLSQDGKAHFSH